MVIYLFVFVVPSALSDVLQIKVSVCGGGSSAGGKTKRRPSFLSVITLLSPPPAPSLPFIFFQALIATLTNDNARREFMLGLGD